MPPATCPIRLASDRGDDDDALAAIYAPNVRDTAISFELIPPDAAEMGARRRAMASYAPWLVCVDGARVRGYAYAARHRERAAYQWSIDVSVYVDAAERGRGVGAALYASLLALVRLQGFYAAHAGITLPNDASVGIHESFGFRRIGVYPAVGHKHGAWHDVGWWQLPLRDRVGEPPPPRTPAELTGDPGWAEAMEAGLGRLR